MKKIDIITDLILGLGIILFISIAVSLLYTEISSYNDNRSIYNEVQKNITIEESNNELNTNIVSNNSIQDEQKIISVDLNNIGKNCIGWIYLNDSNINYPIMKCSNNEYYLDHSYNGTYNKYGAIFLDYQNYLDDNAFFVYGHNAINSTMFSELKKYLTNEYYDSHKEFYLGFKTNSNQITLKPYYICGGAILQETDSTFNIKNNNVVLTSYIKQHNILPNFYDDYSTTDNTVFLITCHGQSGTNKRLILMLKEK